MVSRIAYFLQLVAMRPPHPHQETHPGECSAVALQIAGDVGGKRQSATGFGIASNIDDKMHGHRYEIT